MILQRVGGMCGADTPVFAGAVARTRTVANPNVQLAALGIQFPEKEGSMPTSRLLLVAFMVWLLVAPLAAQSASDKIVPSQPQLDGLVAPPEFRAHVLPLPALPPLAADVRVRLRGIQPEASYEDALAEDNSVCYSIRSYRVTRDDPASDSTRLAGYSECQTAARFQVKAAVDRGR
jgi:hypothetical protein